MQMPAQQAISSNLSLMLPNHLSTELSKHTAMNNTIALQFSFGSTALFLSRTLTGLLPRIRIVELLLQGNRYRRSHETKEGTAHSSSNNSPNDSATATASGALRTHSGTESRDGWR